MNDSKNVHGLESDLRDEKQDLRHDLDEIAEKAREATHVGAATTADAFLMATLFTARMGAC